MTRTPPVFERYDERFAAGLVKAHDTAGGLPGFLGIRVAEVWAGGLRAVLEVRPELLTPFGNLHGGVIAALVDHVLGTVCYPVMPSGSWAATTEFKLNYLAPVTSGTLEVTASVQSLTRRTAVVQMEVLNGARTVCLAQGTVLVMPPRDPSPPPGD
ncbi:MAG: PaaI family thioesterase [Acidimicrobiales bacterium]